MRTKLVFNAAAILLTSAIFTELILYRQNTLLNNSKWESTKISLSKGCVGAVAFFTSLPTLSGNHLNLGSWHGLNEVTLNSPINPSEVNFQFLLVERAYVIFEYNRSDSNFSGIRLSRSNTFDNLQFTSTLAGKFETKETISNVKIKDGWNHFRAQFSSDSVSIFLNNVLIFTDHSKPVRDQKIGFRSSTNKTLIDEVTITQLDGSTITESFRNTRTYIPIFMVLFIAFSLLAFLSIYFGRARLSESLLLICSIGFGGIILFSTDFLWLSNRYPVPGSRIEQLFNFERVGFKVNVEVGDAVIKRILETYEQTHKKFRILFVGSSQTWGAGAAKVGDTMAEQVEKILNETHSRKVEVINTGIIGGRSKDLFRIYEDGFISLRPDMVIINLANNDQDKEAYRANLEKFVQLNKQKKIQTVFVLEPNYLDALNAQLVINHEVMRSVGKLHNIPVIDLHDYLTQHFDDGLMWWDYVHMTSFAQRVAAKVIVESLKKKNLLALEKD
jgi:lysophospholipase L1-like esterase